MTGTDSRAVGAQLECNVRPAAYRLRDEEASEHYGRDLFVYWSPSEIRHKAPGAEKLIGLLDPLYDRATLDSAVTLERERMRALIADDASAATYQSLGQYRTALLRALRA